MSDYDFLELSPVDPAQAYSARVVIPEGEVPVWQAEQPVSNIEDPRIFSTRFLDGTTVHPAFRQALIEQAGRQNMGMLGFGGKKVREAAIWQLPAARLLSLRALLFFCRVHNVTSAHTTDRWANVLEDGDYSYPHSHYDSQASLVYYLDPGSPDREQKLSGRFHFCDPRIPYCCSTHPERPTRGLLPDISTGTMILFPSEFLHFVHPYRGQGPRITLAWNISPGARPSGKASLPESARGMFGK